MFSAYSIDKDTFNVEEKDLQIFQLKDLWVVTNHKTHGWVTLDSFEITLLLNPLSVLTNDEFSHRLFSYGIIKKNNQYIYNLRDVDNRLYIFEVNTTNLCNLKCDYCLSNFNHIADRQSMSIKMAEHFCRRILNYSRSINNAKIIIEFSGGEPFLNFDVIQFIIQSLDSTGINTFFNIQTNGTQISDEYLEFLSLYKEKVQLAISLDGITELHNVHRRDYNGGNAFNSIIKAVELIRRYQLMYTFVTVVHDDNLNDLEQIVKQFFDWGVLNFSLLPLLPIGMAKSSSYSLDQETFVKKLCQIHHICKENWESCGKLFLERNMGIFYSYLFQPDRKFMCQRSPCGAGVNIMSISPSGEIYPCYGFQGMEDFSLGNITNTDFFDLSKHPTVKKLNERCVKNIPECSMCDYQIWCQSGCASNAVLSSQELLKPDYIKCDLNKEIIKQCLLNIVEQPENINYFRKLYEIWK